MAGVGPHLLHHSFLNLGRDIHDDAVVDILGLVVVKLHILDHFARQRCVHVLIAQDPDFDFTGDHSLLYQDTAVILEGQFNGLAQLIVIFCLGNPNG